MTEYNPGEALLDTHRRLKRYGMLLIVLVMGLMLIIPALMTPTVDTNPLPTLDPAHNKLGVHLLLDDGRGQWPVDLWDAHLDYASQAVGAGGYVTQLIRSEDLNVPRWQTFMDLCAERNLTPILRLATVYDREHGLWEAPPVAEDNTYQAIAQDYADFVAALKWPTDTHYVIVGNEPNHGEEWGGTPDPAAYARFLIDVADALHAADSNVRVLNAGFDSYTPHTGSQPFENGFYYIDAETFLDEMIAAEPDVFSKVDIWASHAYPLGLSEPPWQQTFQIDRINDAQNPQSAQPPEGITNRGINGYEWELWKLSTYGIDGLPVMITETGWRHAETTDPDSLDGSGDYPPAATVAQYFELALYGNNGRYSDLPEGGWTPWLVDDRVMAVTPFALDGNPVEWGHTNWLALDASGTILDVYFTPGGGGSDGN